MARRHRPGPAGARRAGRHSSPRPGPPGPVWREGVGSGPRGPSEPVVEAARAGAHRGPCGARGSGPGPAGPGCDADAKRRGDGPARLGRPQKAIPLQYRRDKTVRNLIQYGHRCASRRSPDPARSAPWRGPRSPQRQPRRSSRTRRSLVGHEARRTGPGQAHSPFGGQSRPRSIPWAAANEVYRPKAATQRAPVRDSSTPRGVVVA